MRFVVIGDTTLDITVRPDAEPMPGRDQPAWIQTGPGGQGANVAVRLARRGAAVQLISGIAADEAGTVVQAALAADGVGLVNLDVPRTGMIVSLVDGGGERAMLSDRASFAVDALQDPAVAAALAAADWIHVSGYPLADPASGDALADLVASRPSATRCSLGGGSLAPGSAIGKRLRHTRPDLLVFDPGEGLAALDVPGRSEPGSRDELAHALHDRYHAVTVITDGVNPVVATTLDGLPTWASAGPLGGPAVAVDATGAGDAFAAELITTLARGAWPPSRSRLRRALAAGVRLGAEVAAGVGAQTRVPSEAGR